MEKLRVAITAVDTALLTVVGGRIEVLLMPVHQPPHYPHMEGLPGGIIDLAETAEQAAARHLKAKAGLEHGYFEQLHTFSAVDRDKRSRSISIAYLALMPADAAAAAPIGQCKWRPVDSLPELAFDHAEMVALACSRLRSKLHYTTLARHLLPERFTLAQLQTVYETVLGRPMDKRNFRRKFTELDLLQSAGTYRAPAGRPAELFRFRPDAPAEADIL